MKERGTLVTQKCRSKIAIQVLARCRELSCSEQDAVSGHCSTILPSPTRNTLS